MTDRATPPDLDRILSAATVPAMPAGLIDRIVAEATRADRAVLPPTPAPRPTRARWARRGVRTGIVAASLMLATAVAAAFGGGGGPILARIATVARHVADHIRHPFGHAAPPAAHPAAPTVHRMAVPAAAIGMTAAGGVPMAVPRPVIGPVPRARGPAATPIVHALRIAPAVHAARPGTTPRAAFRPGIADRDRHAHRPPHLREPHGAPRPRPDAAHHRPAEPRLPSVGPIAPRVDPVLAPAPAFGPPRDGMPRVDGDRPLDAPRWQAPRTGDGNGVRRPGWRQRQQPGGGLGPAPGGNRNPPGWRRRAGMGGGPRMKPPRPGGGRRRRF